MSTRWFYTRDGRTMLGPFSSQALKQLASTGQILPTDRVRKASMERTVRARRVKGLLFAAPAAPAGPQDTVSA
jgi:uncharacterized protein DUF4339